MQHMFGDVCMTQIAQEQVDGVQVFVGLFGGHELPQRVQDLAVHVLGLVEDEERDLLLLLGSFDHL